MGPAEILPPDDASHAHAATAHPDVAAAGINPLLHFARTSGAEGRLSRRPLDSQRRALESLRPMSSRAADAAGAADHAPAMPLTTLLKALVERTQGANFVVSVSHDDYEQNYGGVQAVIRDERLAFEREGWTYLHLRPAAPLPLLATSDGADSFRFVLRLGAECLGIFEAGDVTAALGDLRRRGSRVLFIVHHMLGHAPEALLSLARTASEPVVFWAHDYFALCPNYMLLRNDVRFCGAPPPTSAACGICVYGADRRAHLDRMHRFFAEVRPIVLFPSEVARKMWLRNGCLSHRAAYVQPLARLVPAKNAGPPVAETANQPLRIAHLGVRVLSKGWPTFAELAMKFARDPRYAFYQLGAAHGDLLPGCIRHVNVMAGRDNPAAMIEAIAEHRIDVVISWSAWRETFCLAAYEALAAGAFVLGGADSGNVAAVIEQIAPAQSRVLNDEESLFALFEGGALKEMVADSPRRYGTLLPQGGTAGWLRRSGPLAARPPRLAPLPDAPETVVAVEHV